MIREINHFLDAFRFWSDPVLALKYGFPWNIRGGDKIRCIRDYGTYFFQEVQWIMLIFGQLVSTDVYKIK